MADSAPLLGVEKQPSIDALRTFCYSDPEFAKRYEGWEPIGRGAFATVVKVSLMGQPVALKIFTNMTDERRARLRAEFASTVKLTSPHLVRTYSAFENGSIAWIEMEVVDGSNLEDDLKRRDVENEPFPLTEALDIATAVTGVVVHAHQEGIVHRDIKPANILLPRSRRPIAKLGDFGIARLAGATRLTAAGAFPGTPRWGAPEAFAGKDVGSPADVYSLSLCLFALFTNNRSPWVMDDDPALQTLVDAHVKKTPLKMSHFVPSLPRDLDTLVHDGLAKRPDKRPTAEAMFEVLGDTRRRLSSNATPVPTSVRLRARKRAVVAALVVAVVATIGVVILRGSHPDSRVPLRQEPSRNLTTDGNQQPRTASPSAVAPAVSRQSSQRARDPFEASLRGRFIRLSNGAAPLAKIEVVLVAEDGARYDLAVPGNLGAFETMDVAIEGFAPPAPTVARFRQVLITAANSRGKRLEATFPVPRP